MISGPNVLILEFDSVLTNESAKSSFLETNNSCCCLIFFISSLARITSSSIFCCVVAARDVTEACRGTPANSGHRNIRQRPNQPRRLPDSHSRWQCGIAVKSNRPRWPYRCSGQNIPPPPAHSGRGGEPAPSPASQSPQSSTSVRTASSMSPSSWSGSSSASWARSAASRRLSTIFRSARRQERVGTGQNQALPSGFPSFGFPNVRRKRIRQEAWGL